jgi:hypothetical protein
MRQPGNPRLIQPHKLLEGVTIPAGNVPDHLGIGDRLALRRYRHHGRCHAAHCWTRISPGSYVELIPWLNRFENLHTPLAFGQPDGKVPHPAAGKFESPEAVLPFARFDNDLREAGKVKKQTLTGRKNSVRFRTLHDTES